MANNFNEALVDSNNWSANYTQIAKQTGEKSISAVRERIIRMLKAGKLKVIIQYDETGSLNVESKK